MQGANLVFLFDLGGGQGRATSDFFVSDGLWHTVVIVRRGSLALVWIDNMPVPVAAQAPGLHSKVNAPGRVYLGKL